MRILFFSPLFAPVTNPEAIVNAKLVAAMIEHGWHVDVISRRDISTLGYDYGSQWEGEWKSLQNITHEVSYETGGFITRKSATVRAGLRLGHPIIGCRWAEHAFDLAIKMHSKSPYDVVLSRSLPDAGHLPALAFAKKSHVPWIANWNDASGEKNLPPSGHGADTSLGFFHDRFLDAVAERARWHTFPSERMRRYICGYLKHGSEGKSSTIPHLANSVKVCSPQNSSFTLCYTGNLFAGRDPELLFSAMKRFKGIEENFRFVLVGLEGVGLADLVQRYDLQDNVDAIGPVSYERAIGYCSNSDVLLILESDYAEGIYFPSKFVDYLQTGRPILSISPKVGTLHDIHSEFGGGVAVDCTSTDEIFDGIVKLYESWKVGGLDASFGSAHLESQFGRKAVIGLYERIFSNLTSNQ